MVCCKWTGQNLW